MIRCSSLPRIAACAAAADPPAVRVEPDRGPADLGSAFHEVMAKAITGHAIHVDDTAAEHNVDAAELHRLAGWGLRIWDRSLRHFFPDPVVEMGAGFSEGGVLLTGTPDLVSYVDNEIRILDWKTGWLDADASQQLKGYGFLKWQETLGQARTFDQVRLTKLGVRRQVADTLVWSDGELSGWWQWLKRHLADRSANRPGHYCGRCPRALECDGHLQQIRALAIVSTDPCIVAESPADRLAVGVLWARQVAKRCEQFLEAARAHVEAQGGAYGPLVLRQGTTRSIDMTRAFPTLYEDPGLDRLLPLLKIGKDALEAEIKKDFPRGQKGAAVKALHERLEAAGAFVPTTRTSLEVLANELGEATGTDDDGA
jgi:hypothetical protein